MAINKSQMSDKKWIMGQMNEYIINYLFSHGGKN